MQHNKLKMWIVSALFAAIIAIFAQITIPLPLIPITGQTLAVGLAVTVLGLRYGTLSVLLYILLGAIGLPVFSGMKGGIGIILGPTGGYIAGFLVQAIGMGLYFETFGYSKTQAIIANILGMFITLAFGTAWLKVLADLTWVKAVLSGTAPFIIVGLLKAVIAGWVGAIVRERLVKIRLLETKVAS